MLELLLTPVREWLNKKIPAYIIGSVCATAAAIAAAPDTPSKLRPYVGGVAFVCGILFPLAAKPAPKPASPPTPEQPFGPPVVKAGDGPPNSDQAP